MLNTMDIVRTLGCEVVTDLENAVERGFIKSRQSGEAGQQALEHLLVMLLASIVAPPSDLQSAKKRAANCADMLQLIVTEALHIYSEDGDQRSKSLIN